MSANDRRDRRDFAVASGTKFGTEAPRPISQIVREILRDWKKPYYGAVPYLHAMWQLDTLDDSYGADSATSIVLYFLSNAKTWRGPVAQHIKAELKAMLKEHERRAGEK